MLSRRMPCYNTLNSSLVYFEHLLWKRHVFLFSTSNVCPFALQVPHPCNQTSFESRIKLIYLHPKVEGMQFSKINLNVTRAVLVCMFDPLTCMLLCLVEQRSLSIQAHCCSFLLSLVWWRLKMQTCITAVITQWLTLYVCINTALLEIFTAL